MPRSHHPHPARLAILVLDAREKVAQCRIVGGVSGQHLVGQWQPLRRHHQCNDHLHAVAAPVARVAKPALVALVKRRVRLEVSARQIVEQDIELDVEQILPPAHQMVEHRALVFQYPVVTRIELMDVAQAFIGTEEVFQRTALEPLPVQPPLTSGREQPISHQHKHHLVPARALAASRQALRPESVQLQALPQLQRQPA